MLTEQATAGRAVDEGGPCTLNQWRDAIWSTAGIPLQVKGLAWLISQVAKERKGVGWMLEKSGLQLSREFLYPQQTISDGIRALRRNGWLEPLGKRSHYAFVLPWRLPAFDAEGDEIWVSRTWENVRVTTMPGGWR